MKVVRRDLWGDKSADIQGDYSKGASPEVRRMKRVLRFFESTRVESMLDGGCGTGELIARASKLKTIRRVFGFDQSAALVKNSRENLAQSGVEQKGKVFKYSIGGPWRERSIEENPVDCISLLSVIPYVPEGDAKRFLCETVPRITKSGATVFISFPNKLFDLASLNSFTPQFLSELYGEALATTDEAVTHRVADEILHMREAYPAFKPKSDFSGYSIAERKTDFVFRRFNPLTATAELADMGLRLQEIFFMGHHLAPPGIRERLNPQLLDAIRAAELDYEQNLDYQHWTQMFTCSTFLVRCSRQG
jgi:SAM-dependent methyltransferase